MSLTEREQEKRKAEIAAIPRKELNAHAFLCEQEQEEYEPELRVEAIQWKGNNSDEIWKFMGRKGGGQGDKLVIGTPRGRTFCCPLNDWIIKNAQGEFYISHANTFKATYKKVEGENRSWICVKNTGDGFVSFK